MKNIKYKVWSEMYHKMFDVVAIMFLYNNGNVRVKVDDKPDCKEYDTVFEYLRQWTGLFDKNDIEIYENDVVVIDGYRGVIFYDEENARFAVRWKDIDGDETYHCGLHLYAKKDIEIIGNVYENENLLK